MKSLITLILFTISITAFAGVQSDIKALHDSAYSLLDINPQAAMLLGKEAEEMAAIDGLVWEEANSIFIQAWLHEEKQEAGKAFILYLKAIEMLRPISDNKREANLICLLLRNVGLLLKEHHAIEQAHQFLDEGIAIALNHNLWSRLAYLYLNKAEIFQLTKENSQAIENVVIALNYANLSVKREVLIDCLNLKGTIEIDLQQSTKAIDSFHSMIDYAKELSPNSEYSERAWHNIGFAYKEVGEYSLAKNAFRKSLDVRGDNSGKSDQFITLIDLCDIYLKTDSTG